MRRVVVLVAVLGCLVHAAPSAQADSYSAPDEARMFQKVNAARAARGLPSLVRSDALVTLARRHSSDMAAKKKLFHTADLAGALQALGVHASWTGENTVVSVDIDSAMADFLASPHHYDNIVRSNYTALGVGVLRVGDLVWVTQEFAEIRGVGVAAPAPPATHAPAPVVRMAPLPPPPTPKPTPIRTPSPPTPTVTPNALEHGIVFYGVLPVT
jgi:hypothetical protein